MNNISMKLGICSVSTLSITTIHHVRTIEDIKHNEACNGIKVSVL